MAETRPKYLTKEIALKAATPIAHRLAEHPNFDGYHAPDLAREIVRQVRDRRYIDGYDLAKDLEDHEGWGINFEIVEILNDFSGEVDHEMRAAEKEWFERVKPQPPLPLGARVQVGRDETGIIDEIYKYGPAKYCVKIDGDPKAKPPTNSRRIIDFEDARASA